MRIFKSTYQFWGCAFWDVVSDVSNVVGRIIYFFFYIWLTMQRCELNVIPRIRALKVDLHFVVASSYSWCGYIIQFVWSVTKKYICLILVRFDFVHVYPRGYLTHSIFKGRYNLVYTRRVRWFADLCVVVVYVESKFLYIRFFLREVDHEYIRRTI